MDRAANQDQAPPALLPFAGRLAATALTIGRTVWRGDRRLIRQVFAGRFASIGAWLESGRAAVVKSGAHRTVYRFELVSGTVFLKHFKIADWRARCRIALLGASAEREARAAARVSAAGIRTALCAAVGTSKLGLFSGESFLMTHAIPRARPLDDLVRGPLAPPHAAGRLRRDMARELGRLVGRLHRARLTHGDLHPSNVLANVLPDGGLRLWLIDLQRVRRHRWLRPSQTRWDLFGLYNFFNAFSGRSDRRRFFIAYDRELHAAAGRPAPESARAARQIESFCRRALRREQIRNDRKWQRSNRRLIVADRPGCVFRGIAGLGRETLLRLRDDPAGLFRAAASKPSSNAPPAGRTAVIELSIDGHPTTCDVVETIRPAGLADRFPEFRWSATRRRWEMGHALLRRGISTARPVLYLKRRESGTVREVLAVERTTGCLPLPDWIDRILPGLERGEARRRLNEVARLVAHALWRMHEFRIVHRELCARRVLIETTAARTGIQIAAVHAVGLRRCVPRSEIVAELARFVRSLAGSPAVCRTLKLRFLRNFLGERFSAEWRSIWFEVQRASEPTPREAPLRATANRGQARRAAALLWSVGDATLWLGGCQAFPGPLSAERSVSLPVRHQVRSDQLLILSDFKLSKDHSLVRELNALREQVSGILELPMRRDPIVVYLFQTEAEYRRYMKANFPPLPPRSAYFVGTSTELAVYTHWGENVREDLRHEYTHGLLHSSIKHVPLWLDEGLAEYFEVIGPRPGGINQEYARRLAEGLASGWQPDLRRLEGLNEQAPMKRADYEESWAWVHFLLNSTPDNRRILLTYLSELRTLPDPKPLSHRLRTDAPGYSERFAGYVSQLHVAPQTAGSL